MIIIKFQGRLGNQIFQYAFALSTAKKIKTILLIDKSNADNSFFKYFNINSVANIKYVNNNLVKFFKKRYKKIHQTGNDTPISIKNTINNNVYYDGFFQSEEYFENIKSIILKKMTIKKRYVDLFQEKYGQLFLDNKILAIHCRLGDYLEWGSDTLGGKNLSLPVSYYRNSLKRIKNLEDYKIIVVTDDIENIKNKFDFISDKMIVSSSEIIDFQILQNSNKIIISNSSFSWWAAYLGKSKKVYAPKYWLGFKVNFDYPNSIIPSEWESINVF